MTVRDDFVVLQDLQKILWKMFYDYVIIILLFDRFNNQFQTKS